jgi:hypothetical protein
MPLNDKNIENRLLENEDIDGLIAKKISQNVRNEIEAAKINKKTVTVDDFHKVPVNKIFDAKAIYVVFNRKTQTESFINGIQADSLIGLNQSIRNNLKSKFTDNFTLSEYYVRFYSFACESVDSGL